jgi:HlyD family secretion protein
MPQLFPPEIIENTVECYHTRISRRSRAIYVIILLMILAMMGSMPLIYVDISTQSRGIVRSPYENTVVQTAVYGEVVSYRMFENKAVSGGDTLLVLNTDKLDEQIALAQKMILEYELFVRDIGCLLSGNYPQLSTAKYRGEYYRFKSKLNESQLILNYLQKELETQKSLVDQKVISGFDYLLSRNNYEKAVEQLRVLEQEFKSNWLSELTTINQKIREYKSNIQQLENEKRQYVILAPVSGMLVQVAGFQQGNFISPTQNLAYVSSNDILLAECFIAPSDIGYLKQNQQVTFQFDAFNHRDWGMVQGKISQMLHDVMFVDQKPMFRVRCTMNKNTLELKNGYVGVIQKGLTFTARFHLNRRSLAQLLFDKVDHWLNPKIIALSDGN